MQVLDERKRRRIYRVAAAMFAGQAYEQVRLDEIARRADVGKGTLYTYFSGKEELYSAVMYDSFDTLLVEFRRLVAAGEDVCAALRGMMAALLAFAERHPHLFNLVRRPPAVLSTAEWAERRKEMFGLLTATLRAGARQGLWRDPQPEWTALYIPGMIRAVFLFHSPRPQRAALLDHMMQLVTGVRTGARPGGRRLSMPGRGKRSGGQHRE